MTGTSLDGIDIAICRYSKNNDSFKLEILADVSYPFPEAYKEKILNIIENHSSLADIARMHFLLPQLYYDGIKKICNETSFDISRIDAVGIHGQTIWHEPQGAEILDRKVSSTFQLGSISALAQYLGKPVVGDFRSADIALGGQGAPLVPIFDYHFLSSDVEDRIALNIGGIANLTYLPANCSKNDVIAFDTGPGNVWLDWATQKYFNKNFDLNGEIAKTGKVDKNLLDLLMGIPFISKKPPKSTGRELFNVLEIQSILTELNSELSPNDIICTLTEFTAVSITENIKAFANPKARLILSGGGANNIFLVERIKANLPDAALCKSDEIAIPSDSKEAICFAFLAYLTLSGLTGNLPSVTGAGREAVLGVISVP